MHLSTQLISIVFAVIVCAVVFEMVRQRRLRERYAILWLTAALVLLVLAAWTRLLSTIASVIGIATPSNAFFVIAFAFLLLLLLHFSEMVSRLTDETRVLAQRLALLEQRTRSAEPAVGHPSAASSDPPGTQPSVTAAGERPRSRYKR